MEAKPIITCNRIRFLFKFNILVSLNYSSSFKLVVLSCKLLISQTIRLGVMSSAYPWSFGYQRDLQVWALLWWMYIPWKPNYIRLSSSPHFISQNFKPGMCNWCRKKNYFNHCKILEMTILVIVCRPWKPDFVFIPPSNCCKWTTKGGVWMEKVSKKQQQSRCYFININVGNFCKHFNHLVRFHRFVINRCLSLTGVYIMNTWQVIWTSTTFSSARGQLRALWPWYTAWRGH